MNNNGRSEHFRSLLRDTPPDFIDRVNTPWEEVADLSSYNKTAYQLITHVLAGFTRNHTPQNPAPSQGVLVLGEAGTGKTHLLMRVARNLSRNNYILFVPKPNNESTITLQIWANIVSSLTRILPGRTTERSQLDDMLAHVFSRVLIPQFENGTEEQQRWANKLRQDPSNLFRMLGQGSQRENNRRLIRNRTITYLTQQHGTNIDRNIAYALISYCLYSDDKNRSIILNWLAGQGGIGETEAKRLGLPLHWVPDEDSAEGTDLTSKREAQALRAIITLGILSTYHQPLILAFDQLEGLRGDVGLTQRWGDVVREIVTHAPNILLITCVFPSLWADWFSSRIEASASQRIAGRRIQLETFGPQHAQQLLATHLADVHRQLDLPTPIYPFEESDIEQLCAHARSPREFLQAARDRFETWLFQEDSFPPDEEASATPRIPTREQVERLLREELSRLEVEFRQIAGQSIPIEEELFGRTKQIVQALLADRHPAPRFYEARYGSRKMPLNIVVHAGGQRTCFCVLNATSVSLTAYLRNLRELLASKAQYDTLLILRDYRCGNPGAKGQEHLQELRRLGTAYLEADEAEMARLNALYDVLVAIEQKDLSVSTRLIDNNDLLDYLRASGWLNHCELWRRAAALSPAFAEVLQSSAG